VPLLAAWQAVLIIDPIQQGFVLAQWLRKATQLCWALLKPARLGCTCWRCRFSTSFSCRRSKLAPFALETVSQDGTRGPCATSCVFVFQRRSERGHSGVVWAAHGSWAGFKCGLRCLLGRGPADGVRGRLVPSEGRRVHSQVTQPGSLPALETQPAAAPLSVPLSFRLPTGILVLHLSWSPGLLLRPQRQHPEPSSSPFLSCRCPVPGLWPVNRVFTICFSW